MKSNIKQKHKKIHPANNSYNAIHYNATTTTTNNNNDNDNPNNTTTHNYNTTET